MVFSAALPGTIEKGLGWSEPAATDAPAEDKAIQDVLGMNQKHILPCPKFLVFSASSLPKSFSLLPTSLLLTSPLLPHSQLPPPSYLPHLILCSLHR
jgi:hypothetical protein